MLKHEWKAKNGNLSLHQYNTTLVDVGFNGCKICPLNLASRVHILEMGEGSIYNYRMVNMNDNAVEYIRDKMGYEDVVIQVITYTT